MSEENKNLTVVDSTMTFFNKLTNTQKYIGLGVVAAVVLSIILIVSLSTETKMATLYTDLEQGDSGKIVEQLQEQEIEYVLKEGGSRIDVPRESVDKIRIDLAKKGLPENSNVGYEIFDKTNLGMSEFVQKLNFRRALEGELANTITNMEEVKKARVHIVVPEKALFKKDQKKPTASVTLHLKSGRSISKISVEGIQNLISSSVEGLVPTDVKVMDNKANMLSTEALDENSLAGKTALQHQQQRNVENYYADKIQSLLDGVLGTNNTKVKVNADLDFTQIDQEKTEYDPDGAVIRSEQNLKNIDESADSLSYPYVNMAKDETNQIANYEISKNVERIMHEVGAIKRLTVSVLINGTAQVVPKEDGEKIIQYTPRSDDEMQKFNEIVRNAVGYDQNRNDQVSVINVPFAHTLDKDNYIDDFLPPWYEIPDNKRIIYLVGLMLAIFILMLMILQSKQVRERIRIAMGLPSKVVIDDYEIEEEDKEEQLEEIEFDDDDLLLLPAELPEQLLLDQEMPVEDADINEEIESELAFERDSLADMASADFDDEVLSEEALMKLEIKGKVEQFMDENPAEAVRLLRIMMSQDEEFKF
jgi:flagellar M-ring protein FliF